jgi:hypothetical protein
MLLLRFPEDDSLCPRALVVRVMRQRRVGRKWVLGCAFAHPVGEVELRALFRPRGEGSPPKSAPARRDEGAPDE